MVAGSVVPASPASAHASLVSSQPRDGQVLDIAPASVVLRFDENMRRPAFVAVTAQDGRQVQSGQVQVLDDTVTEQITDAGAGRYLIAYRVVSADGHPVTAQFSFTVTGSAAASPGVSPASTAPSRPASSQHSAEASGRKGPQWQPLALVAVVVVAVAVLLAPRVCRRYR